MKRNMVSILFVIICLAGAAMYSTWAISAEELSPLAFIKEKEKSLKDTTGEVYLGKVLTVHFAVNSTRIAEKYRNILIELCDTLKTPERKSYRIVLKGYADSTGPAKLNLRLSRQRARILKQYLVKNCYMSPDRITIEAYGEENPIASNKTPEGRMLNRRTEIHVYGNVSEAIAPPPPPKPKVVKKEEKPPEIVKKPAPPPPPKPQVKMVTRGTPPVTEPLPPELRGMEIQDYFISGEEKVVGVVHAMRGIVVVVHRGTRKAYFARPGDKIYQDDAIYTLGKSRCRIKFVSDDVISMASNTHFAVDSFKDDREQQRKKSFFSMLRGKVMFYALRLFRYKSSSFNVKTPTAVVGVRGTKFGVHVYPIEKRVGQKDGIMVADADELHSFMLASGGGGGGQGTCTDAFCEDGVLSVNGVQVPAGFMYHCDTGEVSPTDPSYVSQFEQDTGTGTGKKEKKGKEGEDKSGQFTQIPPMEDKGGTSGGIDRNSQENKDQNNQDITQPEQQPEPSANLGYFSAMLSRDIGDGVWRVNNVYASSSSQDFDGTQITGDSIINPGTDLMSINPGFVDSTTSYITRIVTGNGEADSGSLGTTQPLSVTQVGSTSYMEWGRWSMQNTWAAPNEQTYRVRQNDGWYIFGQATPNTVVSGLTGQVTYSGSAAGTFIPRSTSAQGGILLNGSFSCQVDFTSGSVSNFGLTVTGGGYSASVQNGIGTLNGGQFSISQANWAISTPQAQLTPDQTSARGSLFGPNAENVGGTWGMRESNTGSGYSAVGIFQGSRQAGGGEVVLRGD